MTKLRRRGHAKNHFTQTRRQDQTAWERKLQGQKKDGEITEVTHKNGDVIAKYYE